MSRLASIRGRYALIKLGNAEQPSHNFAAALAEFLSAGRLEPE